MRSTRSFVHLGFLTTAALAISFAAAAPAYHGSARGGGIVTARNDVARNFTAAAAEAGPRHTKSPTRRGSWSAGRQARGGMSASARLCKYGGIVRGASAWPTSSVSWGDPGIEPCHAALASVSPA